MKRKGRKRRKEKKEKKKEEKNICHKRRAEVYRTTLGFRPPDKRRKEKKEKKKRGTRGTREEKEKGCSPEAGLCCYGPSISPREE